MENGACCDVFLTWNEFIWRDKRHCHIVSQREARAGTPVAACSPEASCKHLLFSSHLLILRCGDAAHTGGVQFG